MKNIPLEKIDIDQRPTVANQLCDAAHDTDLKTPEMIGLESAPYPYIDLLSAASEDPKVPIKAIVLAESAKVKDISGLVVVRFVSKWVANSEKQPKRRSQLELSGDGWVVDQIGLSPAELLNLEINACFEGGFEVDEADLLIPRAPVNTRSRWSKIIGTNGVEEVPYFRIGETVDTVSNTDPFVSHSQTPEHRQVYCGVYLPATVAA